MLSKIVIFLASQSPRRRYLIRQAGYNCRVIKSSYEEIAEPRANPRQLVFKHARGKLKGAHIPASARFVVAADTIVVRRGTIYGKPRSLPHAVKMLTQLAGETHDVFTGWAMEDRRTGKKYVRCIKSKVRLKPLTISQIRDYFKKMNPLDKAGSYAVQSRPSIVHSIKGSRANVMGFPVEDFEKIMKLCLKKK